MQFSGATELLSPVRDAGEQHNINMPANHGQVVNDPRQRLLEEPQEGRVTCCQKASDFFNGFFCYRPRRGLCGRFEPSSENPTRRGWEVIGLMTGSSIGVLGALCLILAFSKGGPGGEVLNPGPVPPKLKMG